VESAVKYASCSAPNREKTRSLTSSLNGTPPDPPEHGRERVGVHGLVSERLAVRPRLAHHSQIVEEADRRRTIPARAHRARAVAAVSQASEPVVGKQPTAGQKRARL
jgi:hypothetical protein